MTPGHIDAALTSVRQHLHATPLVPLVFLEESHPSLDLRSKLETRQLMGTFKTRGALCALEHTPGLTSVITASAGNHGLGVGWAANLLGLEATIVVPRNVPRTKLAKLESLTHTVIAPYDGYDDTERYARGLAKTTGAHFISAFDDPWVIAGNGATLAHEIVNSWPGCERIICPVGGGGLASGLIRYCELRAPQVEIVGVQSETNDAMAQSLDLDLAIVSLPASPTLAEGLEGGVAERTFEICKRGLSQMLTVSESSIGQAMALCFQGIGEVIEGSAAVTLAALLEGQIEDDGRPTALIFSGRNVDASVLDAQLDAHLGPSKAMGRAER